MFILIAFVCDQYKLSYMEGVFETSKNCVLFNIEGSSEMKINFYYHTKFYFSLRKS